MREPARIPTHRHSQAGFTLVEFMVYLLVSIVAVTAIFQLVIGQNRLYSKQRELMDVRSTMRSAGAFIAWELRQPSASDGDLSEIGPNSFAVRSIQGTGVICGESKTSQHFGLVQVSGELKATQDDSVLVFSAGEAGTGDDEWKVAKLTKFFDAPGGGVATCFWGDTNVGRGRTVKSEKGLDWTGTVPPDTVIEVLGDVDAVYIGAPIKVFRRVEYGIYEEDGRWWLGRKVGESNTYERLTGPLRPPQDSGLVFTWLDDLGSVTNNAADVALVEVILRGESLKAVRQAGGAPVTQQDTMTFRVALRG
jgi:Tfp pilus assembly protein PilE